jgi:hypothetical protein
MKAAKKKVEAKKSPAIVVKDFQELIKISKPDVLPYVIFDLFLDPLSSSFLRLLFPSRNFHEKSNSQ